MRLWQLLESARVRLSASDIEESRLESELMASYCLGMNRTWLLASLQEEVPTETLEQLESLLERRLQREPLAYILSEQEFFGRPFRVGRGVFVPRPETETLVEEALRILKRAPGFRTVADVGTGSGCIGITLAAQCPEVTVYATDLAREALDVAQENARVLGVERRFLPVEGYLLGPLPRRVDLIVANLPYVAHGLLPSMQPEVRLYEPPLALDGGQDGTALIQELLRQASAYMNQGGSLVLEMAPEQREGLEKAALGLFPDGRVSVAKDLQGLDRVLVIDTGRR